MVEQHPHAKLMGTVPITAGPSVPIVTLDAPSLQAMPGQRWIAILYVTNNSANSIDAVVDCHFTNHGQKVEWMRAHGAAGRPGRAARLARCAVRVSTCSSTR